MSYPGHLLGESYLTTKTLSVYSAAPADRTIANDVHRSFVYSDKGLCRISHNFSMIWLLKNGVTYNSRPVRPGNRIRRLPLCKLISSPHPNECPVYDTKISKGEDLVLELWEMSSASWLQLLPGSLGQGVVVHVLIPHMGQTELFSYLTMSKQMIDIT